MLDLNPRVHLDEVKFAVFIEELNGSRPGIAEFAHRGRADFADFQALRGIERGRGTFLPDLLVAALQRAIAVAEMNGLAVAVAQNLDFDMARLFEIFFKIDRVVAKGRLGLGPRRFERRGKLLRGAGNFHAAPAAAGRCLYENRETERPRDGQRLRIAR